MTILKYSRYDNVVMCIKCELLAMQRKKLQSHKSKAMDLKSSGQLVKQ